MDDIKAKQQIVEKIKAANSILVTVSNSPSVDALSAALGLTLLLDKLDKHPTAVFSGDVPAAIEFLKPEDTFDKTTDSLQDFIIALDKEKADHLRYKVEGDSVKIFITPYKTTITADDLQFSQGDFNVELVIALGVDLQEHLDGALESHGQILHDADIITVTAGEQVSNLGGIDWHDDQASSLSEMVSGLAEALKSDKTKSLLDSAIATAFLTGIVAATDRFSNTHTTSRVMTTAAQLMGAGADQQLIASKLQETHEIGSAGVARERDAALEEIKSEEAPAKDSLSITHEPNETLEDMDKRMKVADQAEAAVVAEAAVAEQQADHAANANAAGAYAYADEAAPIQEETPSLGGTLSATTEQAADDARQSVQDDQNKTILTHSYLGSSDTTPSPMSTTGAAASSYVLGHDEPVAAVEPSPAPADQPIVSGGHEMVIQPSADMAPPVASASPAQSTPTPTDLGLPMPPALPDFSAPPAMTSAYALDPAPVAPQFQPQLQPQLQPQPEILGDILAPEAPVGPVMPAPDTTQPFVPPVTPPVAPTVNDPGQFQIPGQQ